VARHHILSPWVAHPSQTVEAGARRRRRFAAPGKACDMREQIADGGLQLLVVLPVARLR
jgi:hypothetical protein